MSFHRGLKQTPSTTLNTGGYQPKLFQLDVIRASFPDAAKVGSVYICPSTTSLSTGITTLLAATTTGIDSSEYTLMDMGRDLHVGVDSDVNLLVFKKVKRTGTVASSGITTNTPETGYVIVSSKVSFGVSGPATYTLPYTWTGAY
jgi:hypothetical protein